MHYVQAVGDLFPEIADHQLQDLAYQLHGLPHFQPDGAWKARLKARLLMQAESHAPLGSVRHEAVSGPGQRVH